MYKPIIYTSEYLRTTTETSEVAGALSLALCDLGIEHRELSHTNDYWVRDFMPVHIIGDLYAKYEYCPDYLKGKKQYLTRQEDVCQGINMHFLSDMGIIFDGGNYVRCGGKVIMTDKILMENAGYPICEMISYLETALCAKIVLLPWDMADPCGHTDGMVADLGDGKLLLNNYGQHRRMKAFYHRLKKILMPYFEIVDLSYNCALEKDSWCYLNFLKVPGGVLLPCLSKDFSCPNDKAAIDLFEHLFIGERIIPIYAKPLIEQGGALHCVTWEYYKQDFFPETLPVNYVERVVSDGR